MQNMVAAKNVRVGGWAYGCMLFKKKIGSFNASTAYTEKRGFLLSALQNVFQ